MTKLKELKRYSKNILPNYKIWKLIVLFVDQISQDLKKNATIKNNLMLYWSMLQKQDEDLLREM